MYRCAFAHVPDTKGGTAGTASGVSGRWLGSGHVIVSTINVNGIRAAIKERSADNLGLLPWFAATPADVVCLQETRADGDQSPSQAGGTPTRRPLRRSWLTVGTSRRPNRISRGAAVLRSSRGIRSRRRG
jgi:hypothetical protein